jgi:hypothetical protein
MEISGKALGDLTRSEGQDQGAGQGRRAGGRLRAMLRDDGSTACGNWIYGGCWSQAGNLTARRDNPIPPAWARR